MALTADEVMERSRAVLNDRAGDLFTNEVLLPYLNNAWDELQSELQVHGLPVTTQTSAIMNIPAYTTVLNDISTPPLPLNIIEPIDLYERATGTDGWSLMTERPTGLFKGDVNPRLGVWRWEYDGLQFFGATKAVELLIRYTRSLPEIIGEASPILLLGAKLFLVYRTAGEAAIFIGGNVNRGDTLNIKAEWEKSKYISTRVNGLQGTPVRKRGFATRSIGRSHLLPF